MGITIRPPENVYRKPHELVSFAAYLSAALGTVFLPVPPAAVALSAPVLLALSALRAKQGLRIRRYRHSLRILHPGTYRYYKTLRQKLHWGEQLVPISQHD